MTASASDRPLTSFGLEFDEMVVPRLLERRAAERPEREFVVYGDEAWIGSTAWSFVSGHGFRPSIGVGGGVYDHGATDYWAPDRKSVV